MRKVLHIIAIGYFCVSSLLSGPSAASPTKEADKDVVLSTMQQELQRAQTALAKQRELPYCYFAETLGPRLAPRLLYRIWIEDGREELVRGAVFGDLDVRSLRKDLIAAGDDPNVENRPQNVPHSIVSPSLLFDELEVKRANVSKDKLPEYPPPAPRSAK